MDRYSATWQQVRWRFYSSVIPAGFLMAIVNAVIVITRPGRPLLYLGLFVGEPLFVCPRCQHRFSVSCESVLVLSTPKFCCVNWAYQRELKSLRDIQTSCSATSQMRSGIPACIHGCQNHAAGSGS